MARGAILNYPELLPPQGLSASAQKAHTAAAVAYLTDCEARFMQDGTDELVNFIVLYYICLLVYQNHARNWCNPVLRSVCLGFCFGPNKLSGHFPAYFKLEIHKKLIALVAAAVR